MFDPVGGFLRVRELYLTYLETAFRVADPGVTRERRALLEAPGTLCTEPQVEPLPRYRTVEWQLGELTSRPNGPLEHFTESERLALVRLASAGLFDSSDARLFSHQASMLQRGTLEGSPCVVTSGTGSGKTEAFLLPVLASLVREAQSWPRPSEGYLRRAWWHAPDGRAYESYSAIPKDRRPLKRNPNADPFVPHRAGERRSAAMRCLILYPMNALVEDQLSRLRKALDSEPARVACDEVMGGNRIFFGRYTSETPVTGFNVHPRLDPKEDCERRQRRLRSLFDEMVQMERTQRMVRETSSRSGGAVDDEEKGLLPYLFPSVDGSELVTRWDMQSYPPDILITNVSMLGAMLNREVDSGVFERTRQWITEDESAYFYLVLDELHLQRGASGTEVAYLLRTLLDRLGLSDPKHRHKLRLLASSASLPVAGPESRESLSYLWDMFGTFGTCRSAGGRASGPGAWAEAIIAGDVEPERPRSCSAIAPAPFVSFLRSHGGVGPEPACMKGAPLLEAEWRAVAGGLGCPTDGEMATVVRSAIEEAGTRLAAACWSDDDRRPRATPLSDLAKRLFGCQEEPALEGVRALLLVRGLGDAFQKWFPEAAKVGPLVAPTFRLHTFFRSIEGLYAPVGPRATVPEPHKSDTRTIGALSLERAVSAVAQGNLSGHGELPLRLFEVLYCECCGELFVGGMRRVRSTSECELLPNEEDLDGLPENAASQRFEDLSYDQYSVFWPTGRREPPQVADSGRNTPEGWAASLLDPATGVVRICGPRSRPGPEEVGGWLFRRGPSTSQDRHHRTNQHRGTNVPYQCPSCDTDYSPRSRESRTRLSPIRHFRTGFAKTTQLLATELFDLMKVHVSAPKLVSFSDSRQDAAKAALDVESRHHEDLRREIVLRALGESVQSVPSLEALDKQVSELRAARRKAEDENNLDEERRISVAIELLRQARAESLEGSVRVGTILEDPREPRFLGAAATREPLRALVRAFVLLGVHPTHPAGTQAFTVTVDGRNKRFLWHELFDIGPKEADWRDDIQDQPWLDAARRDLVVALQKRVNEILLNRTYFSVEEAGLGFTCLPRTPFGADRDRWSSYSAFLRVFGDSYRQLDSPYDWTPGPWVGENSVPTSNRVFRFATTLWGAEARVRLGEVMSALAAAGHRDGLLATPALRLSVAPKNGTYWRCIKCSRVHLHRGAGICTRCFERLPEQSSGTVEELQRGNFLAKRLVRDGAGPFRLHCEELTGQSEDGPDRQRKFRGLLFPGVTPARDADGDTRRDEDGDEILEPDPHFYAKREEIDVLAVTTTMEVGIDIGPLQSVLQANMPPQRFNYQQRVGRAGRRRQAFSLVLTVCRTRSHDLYYFRSPTKITGDTPPPPFLTKRMPNIGRRFLRKWWLNAAFSRLRGEVDGAWPADHMRPPDIHGEFMATDTYFSDGWRERVQAALRATESEARRFVELLCEDSDVDGARVWMDSTTLLDEIDQLRERLESRRYGLAHSLAEHGHLPMYGMPTRVRDLHVEARQALSMPECEWATIDRDLDLAVFEFAPGSVIVKDKREHVCIGFTGALPSFRFRRPPGQQVVPFSSALGDPFWMMECVTCGSWIRKEQRPSEDAGDCVACGRPLESNRSVECREPLGFRTNFRPSSDVSSEGRSGRHRSVQSEARPLEFVAGHRSNLSLCIGEQVKTYRLNRGPVDPSAPGRWLGFSATYGEEGLTRGRREAVLTNQLVADEFLSGVPESPRDFRPRSDGARVAGVWLAAPKTTDALYLAPTTMPEGLALDRVVGARSLAGLRGAEVLAALASTAVRAAAMSATFILVNRAALELDVDPEEFDIIEPRLFRPAGGAAVPLLEITDHLVNGAGFCTALAEPHGAPRIEEFLLSTVRDVAKYPLDEFTRDHHEVRCEQACYACLLRYRNQPYHGILDWRLGLAFLGVLADSQFRCGLDGGFTGHSLSAWPGLVARDVDRLRRQFGRMEVRQCGSLVAFRFDDVPTWALVGHPLWETATTTGVLDEAARALGDDAFIVVDSFNVARRPIAIRRAMLDLV